MIQNSQKSTSPLLSEEESKDGKIKFIFEDLTSLIFSASQLEDIYPSFFFQHATSKSDTNFIEVNMPNCFTSKCLLDFIYLFKNGLREYTKLATDKPERLPLLLKLSEYFNQPQFSINLIQEIALSHLDGDNSFEFLLISYEKLSNYKPTDQNCEQCWFELFFQSLETLGKCVDNLIKNSPKLKSLDSKIVEELINKCFASLFIDNYMVVEETINETISSNEDNYFDNPNNEHSHKRYVNYDKKNQNKNTKIMPIKDLEKMIDILCRIRNCGNNIFNLLTNEYMLSCSNQSLNEINARKTPTFILKIPYELEHFYEEYPLNMKLNGMNIVLIIFYKTNEDSLSVNLKLADNLINKPRNSVNEEQSSFNIITFLSSVTIDEDENYQMNVKSVSNNKSSINIFKQNNLKKYFNDKTSRVNQNNPELPHNNNSFFTLKINMKICYTHSVLSSFLLKAFPKFFDNPEIIKLPRDFLVLLLKSKYLLKHHEDEIVIALINWLKDEVNIKEDINELIDIIQWEKVNEKLVYEFVIKYCNMIYNEDTELKIIKGLQLKFSLRKMTIEQVIEKMFGDFFNAARAADYSKIYALMMKKSKLKIAQSTLNNNNNNNNINVTTNTSIRAKSNDHENIQKNKGECLIIHSNNDIGSPIDLSNKFLSSNPVSLLNIKDQSHKKEISFDQSQSINDHPKNQISNKTNKTTAKIIKKEELLGKLFQTFQQKNSNNNQMNKKEGKINEIKHIHSNLNTSANIIKQHQKNAKSLSNLHKPNESLSKTRNKVNTKSMSHLITDQPSSSQSKLRQKPLTKLTKKTRNKDLFRNQISSPLSISNTIQNYKSVTTSSSTINQKNVYHLFNLSTINHVRCKKK